MPGSTTRGIRYPLTSEPPAGAPNMQTLATDTNDRLANGGRGTYTFNVNGEAAIPHGLGRTPVGICAQTVNSTLYQVTISSTAANSTNFNVIIFRRDTGAIVPSTSFVISWVVW
jgi:hypothetical protein